MIIFTDAYYYSDFCTRIMHLWMNIFLPFYCTKTERVSTNESCLEASKSGSTLTLKSVWRPAINHVVAFVRDPSGTAVCAPSAHLMLQIPSQTARRHCDTARVFTSLSPHPEKSTLCSAPYMFAILFHFIFHFI